MTARRLLAPALALAAIAAGIAVAQGAPAPTADAAGLATAATTAATGRVPDDIVDRYLTRRPTLGPVTVVDITSESSDRKLLAATLQGIVNRTQARIYLLGARSAEDDQRWLDDYQARGLITVAATVGLDAAVHTFRGELTGYVEADAAEPWTINTATTAAAARGAVVATPATAGLLDGEGLAKLADHRGRWTDATTAYLAVSKAYRSKLPYQGLAIEAPGQNAPRDLLVQQGVMAVYTRPSQPDWEQIYRLIDAYPPGSPVYGYVSDTGDEEVAALVRLARSGHWLVPTDTTDNLSFHLAVGGRTRALPKAAAPDVAPCRSTDVNVVLSFSDGDNLVVPETHFAGPTNFGSPRRGELPVGWGIGGSASVLMPAIWDHYVTTTSDADEIIDMMGLGYALPSLMPDRGVAYLTASFRQQAALGIPTNWSLDAPIAKPDASGWLGVVAAAKAAGTTPEGMLFNYERWPGPPWYPSIAGFPVLASQTKVYAESPTDLAAQVKALADQPASQRSLVTFFAVTNWSTSFDQLADAMGPLRQQGIRFLTPSEAWACLPKPATTTTTTLGTTSPSTTTTVPGATGAEPVGGAPTYVG
ncbi:MAG: GxGYxYP family putative glycoside hydrolase [Acidimicrobiales bacterium]